MLYINGVKATKKDVLSLNENIKKGNAKIIDIKITKAGAIAVKVEG